MEKLGLGSAHTKPVALHIWKGSVVGPLGCLDEPEEGDNALTL